MPPVFPPPESLSDPRRAPNDSPRFAVPYPHVVHHAIAPMPCGCGRRTIHSDEAYVTIGGYERVNCWGCLVYYGWAKLDDVPESIRTEVAATQHRARVVP